MASIRDVYELSTKASLGGINRAIGGLGNLNKGLKDVASLGPRAFSALAKVGPASLRAVAGMTGKVVRGLGAMGLAFEGVKRLGETFTKGLEVMAKASPAFARQLGRVQGRLDAIKNALAKRAGDALAPALERIVKAMDSPKVKKFIDLIGKGLQRAIQTGLGFAGRLLNVVSDLFTEFEDGSRPIDSVQGIIFSLARSFGLTTDQALELSAAIRPVANFIEKQLIPGLLTLGKTLLEGVGQAWQTLQQVIGVVWGWLKANVFDPLFAAAQTIAATFQQKWGEIQAAFNNLWTAVQPVLQFIVDKLSEIWNTVIPQVVAAFQGIIEQIGPAVENIAQFITTHFETIKGVLGNIFDGIKNIVSGAIEFIRGIITGVLQVLQGNWEGAWNTIKNTVERVWGFIRSAVENAVQALAGIMVTLGAALRKPWEAIKGFVEGIWNGIKQAVAAGVNGIIDFINGIIDSYQNIRSTLQFLPDIQRLQRVSFAQGGIASRPVPAIVGDNPISPEVVSPLHELIPILRQALGGLDGSNITIQLNAPVGAGFTPMQAGQMAADAFVQRARAHGVKV